MLHTMNQNQSEKPHRFVNWRDCCFSKNNDTMRLVNRTFIVQSLSLRCNFSNDTTSVRYVSLFVCCWSFDCIYWKLYLKLVSSSPEIYKCVLTAHTHPIQHIVVWHFSYTTPILGILLYSNAFGFTDQFLWQPVKQYSIIHTMHFHFKSVGFQFCTSESKPGRPKSISCMAFLNTPLIGMHHNIAYRLVKLWKQWDCNSD